MEKIEKPCFVKIWISYEGSLRKMPAEDFKSLILSMIDYKCDKELELTDLADMFWPMFKYDMDRDAAYAESQAQNGSRGGKSKKADASKSKQDEAKASEGKQVQAKANKPEQNEASIVISKSKGNISFVSNDTQDISNAESAAPRKRSKFSAEEYVKGYTQDVELQMLLLEWIENRRKKRAPETEGAISKNLEKLPELAAQSGMTMQDYMREIICRGWQALYPIRDAPASAAQRKGDGFDWLTGA